MDRHQAEQEALDYADYVVGNMTQQQCFEELPDDERVNCRMFRLNAKEVYANILECEKLRELLG